MELELAFNDRAVCEHMASNGKDAALDELAGLLSRAFPRLDRGKVFSLLQDREQVGSTAMEFGVAMPHARFGGLRTPCLAVGLSREGLCFDSPDNAKIKLFFTLLAPDSPANHLGLLGTLARILRDEGVRGRLLAVEEGQELYEQVSLFCRQRGITIRDAYEPDSD